MRTTFALSVLCLGPADAGYIRASYLLEEEKWLNVRLLYFRCW